MRCYYARTAQQNWLIIFTRSHCLFRELFLYTCKASVKSIIIPKLFYYLFTKQINLTQIFQNNHLSFKTFFFFNQNLELISKYVFVYTYTQTIPNMNSYIYILTPSWPRIFLTNQKKKLEYCNRKLFFYTTTHLLRPEIHILNIAYEPSAATTTFPNNIIYMLINKYCAYAVRWWARAMSAMPTHSKWREKEPQRTHRHGIIHLIDLSTFLRPHALRTVLKFIN